jgi:hypothetical protein
MLNQLFGVAVCVLSVSMSAACVSHTTELLVPTGPTSTSSAATGATVPAPSPVATAVLTGSWASPASVLTPSSCSNFQYTITSQTAAAIAGTFSAACTGGITLSGTATGLISNPTTILITATGTGTVPIVGACNFSLSGTGTVEDNVTTLRIPYTGTTCLGPVQGIEVLHKATPQSTAPPPPPAPAPAPPAPTPVPPSPPASNDAIDLHSATIMNSPVDVADWPATARITTLDLGQNGAFIDFTQKNNWPDVPFLVPGENLQYTLWIVLNINGHWYASGCIEYWRGLDRNGGPPSQYAQNWYYDVIRWGPMVGHQPAPGEQVGFLVTAGDARNNGNTVVRERSNVVMVPFPSGGGSFSFSANRHN